jgi:hypothetical protein
VFRDAEEETSTLNSWLGTQYSRRKPTATRCGSLIRLFSGRDLETVILLHENVTPHGACWTEELLKLFHFKRLGFPPYIPDPVPSDNLLFRFLKQRFVLCQYYNNKEVEIAVCEQLRKKKSTISTSKEC